MLRHTHRVLIITFLLALIVTGCGDRSDEARVTRRDITTYFKTDGEVAAPAAARADITAPYEAPVEKIYVTVGQAVQRGDSLLLFSAPQNKANYQQARVRLLQAERSLAQAKQRHNRDLQAAQQRLAAAREAEREARTAASSAVDGAESQPAGPGVGPAIARRKSAEQAVLEARNRMNDGLAPYQQAVDSARDQFAAAQAGAKAAQVKSPITGTVLAVNARMGQTPETENKTPLVTVVNLDALHVAAELDNEDLEILTAGDAATVTIEELPDMRFTGRLAQLRTGMDASGKQGEPTAIIGFTNTNGQAKPGMDADVSITTAQARDVLAVPESAVYETDDDRHAVNVREDGEWRRRLVDIGISDGDYTEIISGLSEGDVVKTNP